MPLPQFVEFLEQRQATVVTTAPALRWATEPADASVVWWHQRLAIVRGFARYLQAADPRHEVPPVNLLPAKFRRAVPYLYSEAEIEALMRAAGRIRSPLKAATYQTLIGLLSVTGMRIGEAIALDRADVELPEERLTVRRGKNGRSREVALHPTTITALDAYARLRDEFCPRVKDPSFLITNTGMRLHKRTIGNEFDQFRRATGLDRKTLGRQARIHDIRHSFVLRTLLGWYREERDVEAQLPLLSTFLGHVRPSDTYWYFEGAPELLSLAAERLEQSWERRYDPAAPTAARVLHRSSCPPARRQPPHRGCLPRLLPAAVGVLARSDRPGTVKARARGHQRVHDHRVPLASGARARQQRAHPQRQADRDPLVFHYAALKAPECSELIARVLAIPEKRFDTTLISYLTEPETDALLAAPDRSTWTGRRDHALLLLAVQTGLRATELANLRCQDLQLEDGAYVRCWGKGRRQGAPHSAA